MIERLSEVLATQLDLTSEEIADILWLAQQQWSAENGAASRVNHDLSEGDTSQGSDIPDDAPLADPQPSQPSQPTVGSSPLPPAGLQSRRSPSPPMTGDDLDLGGTPITVPDAPALRGTLGLLRALKPLLRTVPTPDRVVLNETATAHRIAETNIWIPQLEPEQEPWLDLALVIDASPSMLIWRRTVQEMQRLLRQCGAFRDVRLWSLDVQARCVQLRPGYGPSAAHHSPCSPKELIDPRGRRLIWILSDCIDNRWQTGTVNSALRTWANHGPLALVQVLPEWMWERTSLQKIPKMRFYALEAGAANRDLALKRRDRRHRSPVAGIKVPVLTLEPPVALQWSQMVVAHGAAGAAGVLFPEESDQVGWQRPEMTPKERLETFELFSSLPARRLAGLLSGCPVINLPMVRIVQESMLPDSTQVHVAEVLLGGLLQPTQAPSHFANQDEVDYIFHDRETQRALLQEMPPEDTFKSLTGWIQHRLRRSLDEFVAVLEDPRRDPPLAEKTMPFAGIALEVLIRQGRAYLPVAEAYLERWLTDALGCSLDELVERFSALAEDEAFVPKISAVAEILIAVLREKGGTYRQTAEALRVLIVTGHMPIVVEATPVAFELPPLQILDFETGHFITADQPEATFPPLQTEEVEIVTIVLDDDPQGAIPSIDVGTFSFEMATVQRGLLGRWTVRKQRRQAERYIERLGNSLTIMMVAIPGGSFVMGSPSDEPERRSNEEPQHDVRVQGFWMSRYPVTQAQWKAVAAMPQIERKLNPDPSRFEGDRRPVERVSWYEAVEFCQRLSAHTGRAYRLPTEAEWEYACRGGTTTPFHFGEMINTNVANYNGNSTYNGGPKGRYRQQTTPVDEFEVANDFGLSDMHGNVYEWCQDNYHDSYEGAPTNGSAWVDEGADENKSRILRGGSWDYRPGNCRSAYRNNLNPRVSDGVIGFRVVCSAPRALQ
jgi:formylglycine-generating enzyme required for sulfatase activity